VGQQQVGTRWRKVRIRCEGRSPFPASQIIAELSTFVNKQPDDKIQEDDQQLHHFSDEMSNATASATGSYSCIISR